jgi:hypothetical protein
MVTGARSGDAMRRRFPQHAACGERLATCCHVVRKRIRAADDILNLVLIRRAETR